MTGSTGDATVTADWIRSLPKAEVHVHLEGSFELIDLLELAKAAGEPLPGPAATLFDLGTHHGFAVPEVTTGGGRDNGAGVGGLTGFLRFLDWQCGLVRTREQAARHAYRFAARQSASGVAYTDVIVNPTHWRAWRGREAALLAALAAGFDEAEQDGLCAVGICVSLLRQQSSAEGADVARWIARDRPHRVVGLSVDGDERAAPRSGARFAEAFTIARDAGLGRTVHTGESSGPDSVWEALDLLHAQRIDHGIRAVEDPVLLRRLADDGVSLGVCPHSNITLGLYPDLARHPIGRLVAAGVTVTVNTDDPAPLRTTLEAEWLAVAESLGWDRERVVRLALDSVAASFAPAETRERLRAQLERVPLAA
ncbi:MAG: adenosine deaminase [Microbacterium sp.]|uniref:adenosine deaminase n=1 Tax=Microbacterium sp. TaxID=51671 RepID=UPI0039E4CA55